jgi:hypothetical protein
MDIFSSAPGRVSAIDSVGVPILLLIGDDSENRPHNSNFGSLGAMGSIITGIKGQSQGGFQFRHTLLDFVYLYVFGERVGQLSLEGISFAEQCIPRGFHGLEQVNAYYLDNRVAERADPVTIVLGLDLAFYAFLTGFSFDLSDTEKGIGRFSLALHVIPETRSHEDPGGGIEDAVLESITEFVAALNRDARAGTQPPPTTGIRELNLSGTPPINVT